MQAVCVRSLVGELRLHKPHSGAKNQRETGLNRAWTLATAGLTACRPPPSSSRGGDRVSPRLLLSQPSGHTALELPAQAHQQDCQCARGPAACTVESAITAAMDQTSPSWNPASSASRVALGKSPGPSTSACSSVKRHSDTHPGGPSQGVSELHYVKRSPARLTSASH